MHRPWLLLLVLGLVACKDKEPKRELEPKVDKSVGSGSDAGSSAPMPNAKPIDPPKGTAPKLVWKDLEGELLIATDDGKTLTGPCGMTGTLTATDVSMGTQKPEAWNKLLRDGKKYSLPKLDWIIEVSPTGDVVLKQHGDKKPLGNVTGLDTDEAAAWFGAFVVAKHTHAMVIGAYRVQRERLECRLGAENLRRPIGLRVDPPKQPECGLPN